MSNDNFWTNGDGKVKRCPKGGILDRWVHVGIHSHEEKNRINIFGQDGRMKVVPPLVVKLSPNPTM